MRQGRQAREGVERLAGGGTRWNGVEGRLRDDGSNRRTKVEEGEQMVEENKGDESPKWRRTREMRKV